MSDSPKPWFERLARLNDTDREAIKEILEQAFEDNVHLKSFYDSPERRLAKVKLELDIAELLGEIWVVRSKWAIDSVIVGVALMWPPGVEIGQDARARSLDAEYKAGASPEWIAWRKKTEETMRPINEAMPEAGTRYHLDFFGVLRAYRNQGFGGLLMGEIMREAWEKDKLVSLFCAPQVLDFYEKLGFQVVARTPWELYDGSMDELILLSTTL